MQLYDKQVEPLVISKSLIDLFLKNEEVSDMIALYTFYYYTAKWQHTDTAKATTEYTARGLHWSETRVKKIKKILMSMGLIEDYIHKENGRVKAYYIYVRFMWSDNKVKEVQQHMENQLSSREVLQGVENIAPNALSVNNRNALSEDKLYIRKKRLNLSSTTYNHLLPIQFQQEQTFLQSWSDFEQHRKIIKKELNELSAKRCINKLIELSNSKVDVAIELIDQSIEKSFDTFWPLPSKQQTSYPSTTRKRSVMDNFKTDPHKYDHIKGEKSEI